MCLPLHFVAFSGYIKGKQLVVESSESIKVNLFMQVIVHPEDLSFTATPLIKLYLDNISNNDLRMCPSTTGLLQDCKQFG